MLEEEYAPRRTKPFHLRRIAPPEPELAYSIRPARPADLPDIRAIYNTYVRNSVVTFDEDDMTLREWKQKFGFLTKLGLPILVAVSPNGVVLGYALDAPWKTKKSYRYTVESSIYLLPAATGKGLGDALLEALIAETRQRGIRQMLAVIADQGAEASLHLHEKHGFKEIGRMGHVGYKFDRWLGTVLLQKTVK